MIDVTDVQCFASRFVLFRFVEFEQDMFNFGSMQTKPNEQTVMSLPDWPSIIRMLSCRSSVGVCWLGCVCALADKLVPIVDGAATAAITATDELSQN